MITVTVSFKPSESSAEVIAQMVKLLAELENSATTEPNSESGVHSVDSEVKPTKTRKVRVYTDEQKAEFRARMVAAREAKAKTKEDAEIDAKAEPISKSQAKKPNRGQMALIVKKSKSIKAPMPRTGHKVKASPAAQ